MLCMNVSLLGAGVRGIVTSAKRLEIVYEGRRQEIAAELAQAF